MTEQKQPLDLTILPTSRGIPDTRANDQAFIDHFDQKYGEDGWYVLPTKKLGQGVLAVRTHVLEAMEGKDVKD